MLFRSGTLGVLGVGARLALGVGCYRAVLAGWKALGVAMRVYPSVLALESRPLRGLLFAVVVFFRERDRKEEVLLSFKHQSYLYGITPLGTVLLG